MHYNVNGVSGNRSIRDEPENTVVLKEELKD
jgi:hypothetical protein